MTYTEHERRLLARYFSEVDRKDHADVYLVRNLPPEVAATLNGVYSRSSLSMRDNFLQRLKKGLEETGRSLEQLPVPELDGDALTGVLADKSGQFLKTYAIDHGHNSLREGSVLHLAVENVSQLATRFVQRERRCSFEESSTRYISFSNEGHWRDPDVVAEGGKTAAAYEEVIRTTFTLYGELTQKLVDHLTKARPLQADEKPAAYQRALRAEAFDAARYLLTPSILTKWGVVIDARTLSEMITGLLSHPLAEFRLIGTRLKEQGDKVVRTLLSHAGPNEFLRAQHRDLPRLARRLGTSPRHRGERRSHVALLSYDEDIDNRLVASLLYEHSPRAYAECRNAADEMSADQRSRLVREVMAARGPHDPWPIGLEGALPFEFEILVDFGAYRDIGRHRKCFQQQQVLTTAHGFVVPPLIAEAGCERDYTTTLERAAELQYQIARKHPLAAGYVTPFAFLQRVRLLFDPRQLAYFIELRSSPEGHFAYRKIALDLHRELQRVSPLFAGFVRAHTGEALLGRIVAESAADVRRARRMKLAGDA